jgi:hypothetical protein
MQTACSHTVASSDLPSPTYWYLQKIEHARSANDAARQAKLAAEEQLAGLMAELGHAEVECNGILVRCSYLDELQSLAWNQVCLLVSKVSAIASTMMPSHLADPCYPC